MLILNLSQFDIGPMHSTRGHSGTIIEAASWRARMEVTAWLWGLGLGQYESRFRESEIDPDVLRT